MTYIFFRFLVLNQEQTNSGFHRKVPTSVTNNGWTQIFHEIYAITQLCMSSSHDFTNSLTLNLLKRSWNLSVYISTRYNFLIGIKLWKWAGNGRNCWMFYSLDRLKPKTKTKNQNIILLVQMKIRRLFLYTLNRGTRKHLFRRGKIFLVLFLKCSYNNM